MRRLSKKQKNIIKEEYQKIAFHDLRLGVALDLLTRLEKINDYETLNQDVDRLINDLHYNINLDLASWN